MFSMTEKPDVRAWLDDQVLRYINTPSPYYPEEPITRTAVQIYDRFAPLSGGSRSGDHGSWLSKPRHIKRAMLAASIRRLIAGGKIKVHSVMALNHKSMHGVSRRNREHVQHLLGSDYGGTVKTYCATNVLDALVESLSEGGDVEEAEL